MARRVWRCLRCKVALGIIHADTQLPTGQFIPGSLSVDIATATEVYDPPTAHDRTPSHVLECRYCKKRKRWYGRMTP